MRETARKIGKVRLGQLKRDWARQERWGDRKEGRKGGRE